jgi:hypothetical protein
VVALDVPQGDAVVGHVTDPHEALRLGQRQRPQNEGVYQAVDHRRPAEPEPHHEQGDDREARVASQRANGQAQIAGDDSEPRDAALGPVRLAQLGDTPELDPRCPQRRIRREAGSFQRVRAELNVQRDLFVEIAIELATGEQRAQEMRDRVGAAACMPDALAMRRSVRESGTQALNTRLSMARLRRPGRVW